MNFRVESRIQPNEWLGSLWRSAVVNVCNGLIKKENISFLITSQKETATARKPNKKKTKTTRKRIITSIVFELVLFLFVIKKPQVFLLQFFIYKYKTLVHDITHNDDTIYDDRGCHTRTITIHHNTKPENTHPSISDTHTICHYSFYSIGLGVRRR